MSSDGNSGVNGSGSDGKYGIGGSAIAGWHCDDYLLNREGDDCPAGRPTSAIGGRVFRDSRNLRACK